MRTRDFKNLSKSLVGGSGVVVVESLDTKWFIFSTSWSPQGPRVTPFVLSTQTHSVYSCLETRGRRDRRTCDLSN